jgi:hypothetical protein
MAIEHLLNLATIGLHVGLPNELSRLEVGEREGRDAATKSVCLIIVLIMWEKDFKTR